MRGPPRATSGAAVCDGDAARPLVAVVGAGLGGVALALALQHRGVRVRVFERDGGFAERSQGYGLTMQQGGAALSQLGVALAGGVRSASHYSFAPDGRVLGCYGRDVYAATRGAEGASGRGRQNVHVPRQHLREALLRGLQPGVIEWGRRLEAFQDHGAATGGSGGVTLRLAGGEVVRAAVLVGAAGVHSVVRRIKLGGGAAEGRGGGGVNETVDGGGGGGGADSHGGGGSGGGSSSSDALHYLGLIVILGISDLQHPLLHHRIIQTLDGETRLYAMPFAPMDDCADGEGAALEGESSERAGGAVGTARAAPASAAAPPAAASSGRHSVMWQLSFPASEASAATLSARGGGVLRDEALRRCGTWHAPLPALLQATPPALVTGYPVYDRTAATPSVLRGARGSAVTLIGDAAHPMSPFKGQGANQALLDALSLARRLAAVLAPGGAAGGADGSAVLAPGGAAGGADGGGGGSGSGGGGGGRGGDGGGGGGAGKRRGRGAAGDEGGRSGGGATNASEAEGRRGEEEAPGNAHAAEEGRGQEEAPGDAQAADSPIDGASAASCGGALSAALAAFEAEMLQRAGSKAELSREAAAFLHSPAALVPTNCTRAVAARAETRGEARANVLSSEEFEVALRSIGAADTVASGGPLPSPVL